MTSEIENTSSALDAGGVFVCPGATGSSPVGATEAHGGVSISPGAQGGVSISPAKAERLSTHVKTRAAPSRFRFFLFFSLTRFGSFVEMNKGKRISEPPLPANVFIEYTERQA